MKDKLSLALRVIMDGFFLWFGGWFIAAAYTASMNVGERTIAIPSSILFVFIIFWAGPLKDLEMFFAYIGDK